jgi:Tfp pilus assembly protein PilV
MIINQEKYTDCIKDNSMFMHNENGSTFIEVIVAMFILSLIIVGLNAGVVSLINSNVNSKELSSASSAGYQLFEEMRRGKYTDMVSSADTVRQKYLRSWRLTFDSTNSTNSTKATIDLTVSWPLPSLKHTIALATIISKP